MISNTRVILYNKLDLRSNSLPERSYILKITLIQTIMEITENTKDLVTRCSSIRVVKRIAKKCCNKNFQYTTQFNRGS